MALNQNQLERLDERDLRTPQEAANKINRILSFLGSRVARIEGGTDGPVRLHGDIEAPNMKTDLVDIPKDDSTVLNLRVVKKLLGLEIGAVSDDFSRKFQPRGGNVIAPDPNPPTGVAFTVVDGGSDNFLLHFEWTPPTDPGGTVAYEREVRYFNDEAMTIPDSEWISLGTVSGLEVASADSGPFPRPPADQWVIGRVRALNATFDATEWVEDAVPEYLAMSANAGAGPPAAPLDLAVSINEVDDNFSIVFTWTPAANLGGTIGYQRQVKYYYDAALTQEGSDWIDLGTVSSDSTSVESGPWVRPLVEQWVVGRIRAVNAINTTTAWVDGAAAAHLNNRSATGIIIPEHPTSTGWSVSVHEYHYDWVTNRPMAVLKVVVTERPANCDYFRVWTYRGDDPPASPKEFLDTVNTFMAPSGDTTIYWTVPREELAYTLQCCVMSNTAHYVGFPSPTTPVKAVTVTPPGVSAQVTDFDVDVIVDNSTGIPMGVYDFIFTKPVDLEYFHTYIDRIRTDATFTPIPGAEWGEVANNVDPDRQTSWWPLPPAPEYWLFRARTRTRAGLQNETAAPTVQVTVPASSGVGSQTVGDVTLGTPSSGHEYIDGVWYQAYTIPVTPPDPIGSFDRMFVALQAPDDAVTTQKATIGGATPGFIIGAAADASRLVSLSEPEEKIELRWNPAEPIIRIKHPEPVSAEKWRIIVTSGGPGIRSASSVSVVVDAEPHAEGPLGAEHCPNAYNVAVTVEYFTRTGAEQYWRPKVTWYHPNEDPRYPQIAYWDIVIFNPALTDNPGTSEDDRFSLASTEPKNRSQWVGRDDWRVPDSPIEFTFYVVPKTASGKRNTIIPYTTGMAKVTVQRQVGTSGKEAADPVTPTRWTYEYVKDPATGRKRLKVYLEWTNPTDPRYGGSTVHLYRSDYPDFGFRPISDVNPNTSATIDIDPLPTQQIELKLRIIPHDANGTASSYAVGVTPEIPFTIDPISTAAPVGNVAGFSVAVQYLSADYYGIVTLRVTPTFTKPDDPSWASAELWAKREDNQWYLLGEVKGSGQAVLVDRIPNSTADWEFRLVSQDVDSRNALGEIDTTPGTWPTGTPSYTVSVPVATGGIDGSKLTGITAASFAADMAATYLGTSLPDLSNPIIAAKYPKGTPFVHTGVTPPKLYRSNGTSWSAAVDANDIFNASLIVAGGVVAGAIGTAQLASTEILVGGSGGSCPRFVVRDGSFNLLAMIGTESSANFTGAYFRNVKIAPGIASTDKYIFADASGITVKNATIDISNGVVRFYATPGTMQLGFVAVNGGYTYFEPSAIAMRATASGAIEAQMTTAGCTMKAPFRVRSVAGVEAAGVTGDILYLKSGGGIGTVRFHEGIAYQII